MRTVQAALVLACVVGFSRVEAADPSDADPALADRVVVTGAPDSRLQEIDPTLGNRLYRLGSEVIDDQGRGQDAGFDEVLLRAPGVSRESGGQTHLRGEDYGLQYRLNGIQLPEGIASALGQPFDTRLIRTAAILDGALPAQYGLRNAGVIDLQTKSGADLNGQEASLYGGSRGTLPDAGLLLAVVNSDSATHYRPDRTGDLLFTGVASAARRDLLGTGLQLDASWRADDAHTLRAGLMVTSQRERAGSTNTVFPTDPGTGEVSPGPPETSSVGEERRGTLYGVYLQDKWRLGRGLTLNLGGRFDGVSAYVREHAFSPRVTLAWQPCPALTLHAGYARIFSPPLLERITPGEFARYVNTTNAPDTLADDPARAERADSLDVGASWQVLDGLTLGLDAYDKSVRNMQDEEQLGASLIFTPFTYRRGYKQGVEFTASYQRGDWLLYGNAAVAATEGRGINSAQGLFDADTLAYVARHDIHTDYDQRLTASAGAVYHWRRLTLHADGLYGSGFFGGEDNRDELPAHATINAGAAYTFAATRWASLTLRCDVINLTDRSYLLHDVGIGATINQYGERRGFFGGLRCAF